jgi:glycosyltransferase involved in cell wall biosynthesis
MNLLLVAKTMEVGGIERTVVALARELEARGHRVWVVSGGGYLTQELEAQGTPHRVAPLWLISPVDIVRSALLIRRIITQCKIDLIHSFSATSSVAIFLAMLGRAERSGEQGGSVRERRIPVVSSPMGLQNSAREPAAVTAWRNRLLLLGANRVLVISPEIRRHLEAVGAASERLVDFNFVSLDPLRFEVDGTEQGAVRDEFGWTRDDFIVSTIGALHPRKSHMLFLEAARQVADAVPRARFLVVGEGSQRGELTRAAERLGLDGKLVLTGRRDDIGRILAATDVYVKPGVVEGFIGITVLEAMALARPVVAFDTEDVKLALEHERTGLIAERGNPAALADAIVRLLRNPERARALALAGQALVRQRFDFRELVLRLERFYEGLSLNRPRQTLPADGLAGSHRLPH